jgi:hypothetical protein
MELLTYSKSASWRIALRYLFTLIFILVVGAILKRLPVVAGVSTGGGLNAGDLVDFTAKLAALVLFFAFSRHGLEALPDDGGLLSFVRGIATPIVALVIIIVGQGAVSNVIDPFVGPLGKTLFSWAILLSVIGAAIWLILLGYRHSPYLVEAMIRTTRRFSPDMLRKHSCPACGATAVTGQKFCDVCGVPLQSNRGG